MIPSRRISSAWIAYGSIRMISFRWRKWSCSRTSCSGPYRTGLSWSHPARSLRGSRDIHISLPFFIDPFAVHDLSVQIRQPDPVRVKVVLVQAVGIALLLEPEKLLKGFVVARAGIIDQGQHLHRGRDLEEHDSIIVPRVPDARVLRDRSRMGSQVHSHRVRRRHSRPLSGSLVPMPRSARCRS